MSEKPTLKAVLQVFREYAIKTRHEVLPCSFRKPVEWQAAKDKAYEELRENLRALGASEGVNLSE